MIEARCPVVILAGGRSSRLGRDKASEVLAGKTLLQRAVDAASTVATRYVIAAARGQRLPTLESAREIAVVEDEYPETGPLGGIATALAALDAPDEAPVLVLACDAPLVRPALLEALLQRFPGHDAVAPIYEGRPQPLCAVYARGCLTAARNMLQRGDYRTTNLLDAVDALLLPEEVWRPMDPDGRSFLNANREEDLQRALDILNEGV